MPAASHKQFLFWLLCTALCGFALAGGFVLLVDPYGQYHLLQREGINAIKPSPERYQYELKLVNARRLAPSVLLVGNSRVEVGMNPDNAALGGNAYNLGLAGTGAVTAISQLNALNAQGIRPKRVIIGLEFMDALMLPGETPGVPLKLPAEKLGLTWRFDTLFSLTSLKDAMLTLFIQHDGEAGTQTERGFNPLHEYERFARVDGYHKIFRQRAEENVLIALRKAPGDLDVAGTRAEIAAMLDAATRRNPGVDIYLLIYPYHAQLMALIEETGLGPHFDAWKDIVTDEVALAARRHRETSMALYDFSGYGFFNCEAIPAAGTHDATRWYWEAGHFKQALGELVVQRMLAPAQMPSGLDAEEQTAWRDFGQPLTTGTLAANRLRIANERKACAERNPDTFSSVGQLVAQARAKAGALASKGQQRKGAATAQVITYASGQ